MVITTAFTLPRREHTLAQLGDHVSLAVVRTRDNGSCVHGVQVSQTLLKLQSSLVDQPSQEDLQMIACRELYVEPCTIVAET